MKLSTGIASLDAVIQGSWYQIQLDRMGRGLAPDMGASRFWAVLGYLGARRGAPWRAKTVATGTSATSAAAN